MCRKSLGVTSFKGFSFSLCTFIDMHVLRYTLYVFYIYIFSYWIAILYYLIFNKIKRKSWSGDNLHHYLECSSRGVRQVKLARLNRHLVPWSSSYSESPLTNPPFSYAAVLHTTVLWFSRRLYTYSAAPHHWVTGAGEAVQVSLAGERRRRGCL